MSLYSSSSWGLSLLGSSGSVILPVAGPISINSVSGRYRRVTSVATG